MRVRNVLLLLGASVWTMALVLMAGTPTLAQAPAGSGSAAAAPAPQAHGNLAQVMRGILYPASNVIFAAQSTDPATVKQAADPSTATDPLASSYGGWEAVSNAGIALAESANLLAVPRRLCQNGKPAPSQNADWKMWVEGLRTAGMAAYKAGQAKNMDAVLDAADVMSTACQNCHDKYRDVAGGNPARCQ